EAPPTLRPRLAGRLQQHETDGVDLAVLVQAGVGALHGPVERRVMTAVASRVLLARIGRRHLALRHRAVGIALALVEAAGADEANGVPSGRCFDFLPSFFRGASVLGSSTP